MLNCLRLFLVRYNWKKYVVGQYNMVGQYKVRTHWMTENQGIH